jgi:DNA mismatch repair protein MutS
LIDDLPLFRAAPVQAVAVAAPSVAEARLREISPDELTPREALAALYELKGLLKQ